MKSRTRQYLFGVVFMGIGIYYALRGDYVEVSLYALAGTAFIVNALTLEPSVAPYKKPLAIFSWLLIAATGILFLYLLQFKYL